MDYFEEEETGEKDDQGKNITKMENKGICNGPIKPQITFFGESLPKTLYKAWEKIKDVVDDELHALRMEPDPNPKKRYEDGGCDLMFVIGTALAVTPFNQTVFQAEQGCPKVLINLENTDASGFDFEDLEEYPCRLFLKGYCDEVVCKMIKDAGMEEEFISLNPGIIKPHFEKTAKKVNNLKIEGAKKPNQKSISPRKVQKGTVPAKNVVKKKNGGK